MTGRRDASKYRLAPEFRSVKEDPDDRSRRNLARNWSCHNIGPLGCPMKPNPIVTFRGDGSVRLGDHGSAE